MRRSNVTHTLTGILFTLTVACASTKSAQPPSADPQPVAPTPALAAAAMAPSAGDPSGTWTWSFQGPNGQSFEPTLKLVREGDKLSGSISGRNGSERPIEEGKFAGDEVSFKVVRERNGEKFVMSYSGKLTGDLIQGSMKGMRGGQDTTTPWEAKRTK